MSTVVDLRFNHGGIWDWEGLNFVYVGGEVDVINDFDPDYLCYSDILKRYQKTLGYPTVKNMFILEPGRSLVNGLFLVHDDVTIRQFLSYINKHSWVREIEFYADHDIDRPAFKINILPLEYNVSTESNEVHYGSGVGLGEEEYVDGQNVENPEIHTQEIEPITQNKVGGSTYVVPSGYVSQKKNEDQECSNNSEKESDSEEDSDLDQSAQPQERVRDNGQDGKGYFILGMTYGNTAEAREAIAKYVVSFGNKLKLNPNEPRRIRARCINEEHCPFRLLILKNGHNSGLVVKTLVDSH